MTAVRTLVFTALFTAASIGMPPGADALTATLSPAQSHAAIAAGAALARAGRGYPVSEYKLWAAKDTLAIAPGQGALDAVVVATPYERLRYESYLNGYEHKPMSAADIAQNVHMHAHSVEFILFVHSPTSEKRGFLTQIGRARLVLASGAVLSAPVYDRFGPSLDFYNVAGSGREMRWIGYVGARFDLSGVPSARRLRGTLSFVDDGGKHYHFPFDLSHYR